MGQGSSSETLHLETRVENPTDGVPPLGLALIAHGRLGGTFDQPEVRKLAEYLRDQRRLRVVSWNSRGNGASGGGNEWSDLGIWMGDAGVADYNRVLRESMSRFLEDFPDIQKAQLFICGYSAGAIYAGCSRPAPSFTQFQPPRYVLVSYPVDLNPLIGFWKTGSYFRSLEGLVQGNGWPDLPSELDGKEPDVAGVLTVTGSGETFLFYGIWTSTLESKDTRKVLKQVVVQGVGHAWGDKAIHIPEEVDKWLRDTEG
ncbi:hypothetical protein C8R47DRAFT_1160284 [Mycena vitilis]|nr:hypothetical protein C8R47DRAFT_1160284 [Mycena vitilis]